MTLEQSNKHILESENIFHDYTREGFIIFFKKKFGLVQTFSDIISPSHTKNFSHQSRMFLFLAQTKKLKNIWLKWQDIERNIKGRLRWQKMFQPLKRYHSDASSLIKLKIVEIALEIWQRSNNAMALLDIFTSEYLSKNHNRIKAPNIVNWIDYI